MKMSRCDRTHTSPVAVLWATSPDFEHRPCSPLGGDDRYRSKDPKIRN